VVGTCGVKYLKMPLRVIHVWRFDQRNSAGRVSFQDKARSAGGISGLRGGKRSEQYCDADLNAFEREVVEPRTLRRRRKSADSRRAAQVSQCRKTVGSRHKREQG
tara:strand:- start:2611 stop:2925 length:315 start_codon:yes stop_codon:yes gene_type:complete